MFIRKFFVYIFLMCSLLYGGQEQVNPIHPVQTAKEWENPLCNPSLFDRCFNIIKDGINEDYAKLPDALQEKIIVRDPSLSRWGWGLPFVQGTINASERDGKNSLVRKEMRADIQAIDQKISDIFKTTSTDNVWDCINSSIQEVRKRYGEKYEGMISIHTRCRPNTIVPYLAVVLTQKDNKYNTIKMLYEVPVAQPFFVSQLKEKVCLKDDYEDTLEKFNVSPEKLYACSSSKESVNESFFLEKMFSHMCSPQFIHKDFIISEVLTIEGYHRVFTAHIWHSMIIGKAPDYGKRRIATPSLFCKEGLHDGPKFNYKVVQFQDKAADTLVSCKENIMWLSDTVFAQLFYNSKANEEGMLQGKIIVFEIMHDEIASLYSFRPINYIPVQLPVNEVFVMKKSSEDLSIKICSAYKYHDPKCAVPDNKINLKYFDIEHNVMSVAANVSSIATIPALKESAEKNLLYLKDKLPLVKGGSIQDLSVQTSSTNVTHATNATITPTPTNDTIIPPVVDASIININDTAAVPSIDAQNSSRMLNSMKKYWHMMVSCIPQPSPIVSSFIKNMALTSTVVITLGVLIHAQKNRILC